MSHLLTTGAGRARRASPALEIDWDRAGRWAGRMASPGPTGERADLEEVVAGLREAAERALPLARRAARLGAALAASGGGALRAQVIVVDRAGWARAAAQSFAGLTPVGVGPLGPPAAARAAPATGQVATLLSLLAGRVLGQYDPFAAGAPPGGRLLLVAPNVLKTQRSLSAEPADFRLWVAVHEQTHALQFAAAPWLVGHLRGEVAALVEELTGSAAEEIASAVTGTLRSVRALRAGAEDDPGELGLLGLLLDEDQRARVDRVTAVMSLLEGHADVAMDAVGPRAIPSVRRLRARFDARRRRAVGIDRVLRRLLGMEAKLAQYRRGAAFVRTVRSHGGPSALDAVWSGPQALPTPREIADPVAWVRRVHG